MYDEQFEQLARGILVAALGGLGMAACGGSKAHPTTSATRASEPTSVHVATAEPEPAVPPASASAEVPVPEVPSGPERLPETTPQGERCVGDDQTNLVAQLKPSEAVDFISLRRVIPHRPGYVEPIASVGSPCSGAQDAAACQRAVAVQPIAGFRSECIPGQCVYSLLYTRGNSVGMANDVEALTQFLGPIDTEGEAYLLAWSRHYSVDSCSELPKRLKKTPGGYLLTATKMTKTCPIEITQFNLKINTNGSIKVLGSSVLSKNGPCAGRRPAGFTLATCRAEDVVGEYLATSSQLEQASVAAFEQMQKELSALGAPSDLIRDAARAAEDERRHTQRMTGLAARYRGVPVFTQVPEASPRSVYAMALENAVEGCVRETFGALVGLYQAQAAQDAELRAAMADIAKDELRHAALSWRVAAWLGPKLTSAQRLAISDARGAAARDVCAACEQEQPISLQTQAGLPPSRVAVRVAAELRRTLWAHADV